MYSGDANNLAAGPTGCGDNAEAVRVIIPAVTALTWSASAAVTIGGAIHDTAHLSGGARPTGPISFRLYGPANTGCTGRPVFAATVRVAGNDDLRLPVVHPDRRGQVSMGVRLLGRRSQSWRWADGMRRCSRTAIVRQATVDPVAPAFSTTASLSPELGAPLHDVAHLRGGLAPGGDDHLRAVRP